MYRKLSTSTVNTRHCLREIAYVALSIVKFLVSNFYISLLNTDNTSVFGYKFRIVTDTIRVVLREVELDV